MDRTAVRSSLLRTAVLVLVLQNTTSPVAVLVLVLPQMGQKTGQDWTLQHYILVHHGKIKFILDIGCIGNFTRSMHFGLLWPRAGVDLHSRYLDLVDLYL